MKTSNKIFFSFAIVIAMVCTYSFVQNNMQLSRASVLGENDSMEIDDLDFNDADLESSLEELDLFLDSELEEDLGDNLDAEELETDELDAEGLELDPEIESEIVEVETDFEVSTAPQTTKKVTKIQKLFFLVPVEIESEETVTDSGITVEKKQTLLGKLLDLFSF